MLFSVWENTSSSSEKGSSEDVSLSSSINAKKKALKDRLGGNRQMEEFEEMLLQAARNGDHFMVEEILTAGSDGRIANLNVNCRGQTKSNHGWSPLHLASYFGHQTVAELLLKHNADINLRNDAGDTPLHKAAFTGREGIVLLLLKNDAEVSLINGEGFTPKDLALDCECRRLLESAEQTLLRKKEDKLLDAAREGNIEVINQLLKGPSPPNVHSADGTGNTPLHCASYRGQKEVAVLLLQNGADPSVRNKRGQRAVDLAPSPQMKQILDVQPIRTLQRHVAHFEGPLMKRTRFIGWKNVFVILERGVLTYFGSRADAVCSVNRKGFKHMDGAKVIPVELETPGLVIHFSDNTTHRLRLPSPEIEEVSLQKWMNAFQEHIAYSSHYISQGVSYIDSEDEDTPESLKLGSLQDVFQTAQAYQQLLERQLATVENLYNSPEEEKTGEGSKSEINSLRQLTKTSRNMVSSLNHCLNIFMQQEEVHFLQMKQTQERCRVLEQALNVLAKEHHELEQTLSSTPYHSPKSPWSIRSPRFYDTSDDEFYDAHEGDSHSSRKSLSRHHSLDTTSTTLTLRTSASYASACSTLTLNGISHGRTCLPVPMFSRADFNVWSILKHCIGKELSKVTMPVIFNEPLSFLQRISEYLEYSYLIEKANQCKDPVTRLEYITAFAISGGASNCDRLGKPFNPILGETYELEQPNFRWCSEQVSHHPPVSAFHAESPIFRFHGTVQSKLKFWGKSIEIQPKGTVTLELPEHGEAYSWSNVNYCVHNIIVGKLWLEQYGVFELTNHTNGLKSVVTFKPAGWFSKDLHRVEGFIIDKQKNKLRHLYGKWTDLLKSVDIPSYEDYVKQNADKFKRQATLDKSPRNTPTASPAHTPKKNLYKFNSLSAVLPFGGSSQTSVDGENGTDDLDCLEPPRNDSTYSLDIPNSTLLWESLPRPENAADYFQFTMFAMALNELEDDLRAKLPPTDSRLRPDVRLLEEGDIDGAASEKNRLEEKQREARKSRKKDKDSSWKPRFFEFGTNPVTREEEWLYSGGYWDRNFEDCPSIF